MKRIEINLTTEIAAHDTHNVAYAEGGPGYLERYRRAVEAELRDIYQDAEVHVNTDEFGRVYLEGFEHEDKERLNILNITNEIFGLQSF